MNAQWKMVPIEPTREMLVAALKTNGAVPTYAAMLSASPTPPAAAAPPVAWLDPDSIQHGEILSAQAKKNSEFLGQQARAKRFSVPLYAHPDACEIARLTAERDALQQRLNAADQRVDEQRVALLRIRDRADAFAEDERDMNVASVEVIRDIAARALGEVDQSSPDQFRDVVKMIAERTPNPDLSLIGIVHTPPMECDEP